MAESFDPYFIWLGIPPEEQPPNHYRLLGVPLLVANPDVITHAADRQMAHLRTLQTGRNSADSQKLLNEISAARLCLLNAERKAAYDAQLRAKLAPPPQPAPVPPVAVPSPTRPARPLAVAPPPPSRSTAATEQLAFDVGAGRTTSRKKRKAASGQFSWQMPALLIAGVVVVLIVGIIVTTRSSLPTAKPIAKGPTAKKSPSTAAENSSDDAFPLPLSQASAPANFPEPSRTGNATTQPAMTPPVTVQPTTTQPTVSSTPSAADSARAIDAPPVAVDRKFLALSFGRHAMGLLNVYAHLKPEAYENAFPNWPSLTFEGVPFRLVDVRGGREPSGLMFYCSQGAAPRMMPKTVTISCNSSAKVIHMLGGFSGWGFPATGKGSVTLIVRLHYADGSTEDLPLINGVHFAEKSENVSIPGAVTVFKLGNDYARYLKVQPSRTDVIRDIEFVKGPDDTCPGLLAVTIETD